MSRAASWCAFLLLASVCNFLACGGKSGFAGTDAGADGGPAANDTVPAEATLELDRIVDFGRVVLGNTGIGTLTVTNRGASTSGIPTVSARIGDSSQTGNAEPPAVTGCEVALPPGGSCKLTIRFTPTALGKFSVQVEIAAEPGARSVNFSSLFSNLAGTAVGFEVSPPGNIELGDVMPGLAVKRSVTITALIDLADLSSDVNGDGLSIDGSVPTCTATLPKGATCDIALEFIAATIGWKEGFVAVRAGGDFGQVEFMEVTANVSRSSSLTIEPNPPNTPATIRCVWGETAPPVVFTVTNVGPTASGTIAATISGDISERFVVSGTDCSVLAPQASCTVAVSCDGSGPSAAFPRGVLSVTDGSTHLAVPLIATTLLP